MMKLHNRILSLVLALILALAMVPAVSATEATATDWKDPIPEDRIIYDLRAENFHLPILEGEVDVVIDDPDSPFGKAAYFGYAARAEKACTTSSMKFIGDQSLNMYVYGGDPALIRQFGSVSQAQMNANAAAGRYIYYHFEDVNLFPTEHKNYYIYMFECWGFQIHLNAAQRKAILNQTVDVYLSLKVKGEVSGVTGEYFIDRVVIATAVEGSEEHDHDLEPWRSAGDFSHEAMCQIPGCAEVITEDHTWDDGVITKEATPEAVGIKTYTCQECQATRTKKIPYNPETASNQGEQAGNDDGGSVNPILFIAGGAALVVVIAVVVVVVLKKKGKKAE